MHLELTRLSDNGIQTTGILNLKTASGRKVLEFDTLELSWKNNERQVSCIPVGSYVVREKFSFSFGYCFELLSVPGRSAILIHSGNFNSHTKGCILIGNGFRDINNDFQVDVLNSRNAMKLLRSGITSNTIIKITSKIK